MVLLKLQLMSEPSQKSNLEMHRKIISLGFCLFFSPMSPVFAQEFKPFNYGQAIQQAEQIRAMRQRRELELQRYQQQQQQEAWERERLLREEAQRRELQQQQRNQQSSTTTYVPQPNDQDELLSQFGNAIKYRRHRYEDFDEVVFADDLSITTDMIALMAESPYAADLAYYLGTHPSEAAAISTMPLDQAGKAIYSIEKKLVQSDFQIK